MIPAGQTTLESPAPKGLPISSALMGRDLEHAAVGGGADVGGLGGSAWRWAGARHRICSRRAGGPRARLWSPLRFRSRRAEPAASTTGGRKLLTSSEPPLLTLPHPHPPEKTVQSARRSDDERPTAVSQVLRLN